MRATPMLTLGQAAAANAAETPVAPGTWQMVTNIQSMATPGLPPNKAKRMLAKPVSATICISPKAASSPRDVIAKSHGACRYRSFATTAGRITALMECKAGASSPQLIAINCIYSPAGYDIRSKMTGGQVQSVSLTVGKCLGPC